MIKDVRNLFRLKNEIDDAATKDVRNLFTLKKEIDRTTLNDIRNLFRLKRENKVIRKRIIRDIRNLFRHEEENYYKPETVGNSYDDNYIEYESNNDRIKHYQLNNILIKLDYT